MSECKFCKSIFFSQLRYIFVEIQKRFKKHKNYRRVVANMEAQFPEATQQQILENGLSFYYVFLRGLYEFKKIYSRKYVTTNKCLIFYE